MAKIEFDLAGFNKWVKTRPPVIRALCKKLPPDRLYRMKSTGHRVIMYSYSENNTVTVDVLGKYNVVLFERRVFGIDPDDLEECDFPASDEPVGALLTEKEEIDVAVASMGPCDVEGCAANRPHEHG